MKQQEQQFHKCSKKQKRTAKAAMSCLMLLLLYGCAYQGQTAPAVTVLPTETQENDVLQSDDMQHSPGDGQLQTDVDRDRTVSDAESQKLAVFVCGAVVSPGVYELSEGSRVYEAIALAGGMTENAAMTAVNQAELLSDGQMIEIPTIEEQQAQTAAEEAHADGLVNINTAGAEELKTLPGIGDAKARSIIAYREKNGGFGAAEDIKNVEGIGDGVFAKLEGCIKVD